MYDSGLARLDLTHGALRDPGSGGQRGLGQAIRDRQRLGVALVITSALLATQQWLFVWPPAEGRGLPVALGYFIMPIMPIVLAAVGRVVFRERLGPWRTAAVTVAAVAVGYHLALTGGISWETLVVALGYPAYFAIRRIAGITGLAGLAAETIFVVPVAFWLIGTDVVLPTQLTEPATVLVIVSFGLPSSVALLLYIGASQLLPLSVFGLLSYLEPLGLTIAAALILGEVLLVQELPTYIAIGVALVLLALESLWRPRLPRNQPIIS